MGWNVCRSWTHFVRFTQENKGKIKASPKRPGIEHTGIICYLLFYDNYTTLMFARFLRNTVETPQSGSLNMNQMNMLACIVCPELPMRLKLWYKSHIVKSSGPFHFIIQPNSKPPYSCRQLPSTTYTNLQLIMQSWPIKQSFVVRKSYLFISVRLILFSLQCYGLTMYR